MRKYQVRFRGGITEKELCYLAGILPDTSDGRELGLDQRLINPLLPDDPSSKVNACINNIFRIWQDGADDRLTQLVFCDISTPKGIERTSSQQAEQEVGGPPPSVNRFAASTAREAPTKPHVRPVNVPAADGQSQTRSTKALFAVADDKQSSPPVDKAEAKEADLTLEGVAQALRLEDDRRMADAWVESGAHI